MTIHELKIAPEYFGPVFDGIKTFEIRKVIVVMKLAI